MSSDLRYPAFPQEITLVTNSVVVLFISLSLYLVVVTTFRLFFHPLRFFPGPKFAAITWWYKTYYEVYLDGGMVENLEVLHMKYGPIVRIGPNELHFNDKDAFGAIYTTGSKLVKEPRFYAAFHGTESTFTAIDPRFAKSRRDVLGPLFSRRGVLKLERFIQKTVDNLITQLQHYSVSKKPVDLHRAFRSAALDIIISYCFARDYGIISFTDFRHPLLLAHETAFSLVLIMKEFPFVFPILMFAHKVIKFFNPQYTGIGNVQAKVVEQIDDLLLHPESLDKEEHDTIYHHLLTVHPEKGQTAIPPKRSLVQEALDLLAAGSDTTGHTCTVGTFYILSDKNVHTRLMQELRAIWPDRDATVSYEVLEKLPYLTAVIKESLRLSHGVVVPLPRVVGPTGAIICDQAISPGTIVSMGATFMHYDPTIFPDPERFIPDRWLQDNSRELENSLIPFSRGSRMCLGQNLAWCELYIFFANVFRKFDMELFETSIDDLKFRAHMLPTFRGRHVTALLTDTCD